MSSKRSPALNQAQTQASVAKKPLPEIGSTPATSQRVVRDEEWPSFFEAGHMMPEQIPDWVTETWPDHVYKLVVFENNDGGVEDVEMTRAEYIALKAHLAALRGYTIGDFRARIADLMENGPEMYRTSDSQQIAFHLETARVLYRACPDLVVFESPQLEEYLNKLAENL